MFKKLFDSVLGDSSANDAETQEKEVRVNPVDDEANEDDDVDPDDIDYNEEEEEEAYEDDEMEDDGEFDPSTLHGLHYTEQQFLDEVEKRVNAFVQDEKENGEEMSQGDINNLRVNFGPQVFLEWNGRSRYEKFHMMWSSKVHGYAVYGQTKEDTSNPLLQPIHGVSLRDYAAMSSKLASGVEQNVLLKALGIEEPVWAEANALWVARMQEDTTFTVVSLMGQYFGEAGQHPKLGKVSNGGPVNPNVERINNDEMYYYELCGARQAAYEYGIDGAQWILDNFGITLGEFQSAATKWMAIQNQNYNSKDIMAKHEYQSEKQKEYEARFAAEQGGNAADDISF